VKQKLGYAKNNWPSNLKKYEKQEKILNAEAVTLREIMMPELLPGSLPKRQIQF
jgi:hypothetical protein